MRRIIDIIARIVVPPLLFLAVFLLPHAAHPQACAPRDAIIERLASGYEEVARLRGFTSGGDMFEVYLAPSGSWTVIVSRPDGLACIVAVGDAGEVIPVTEGDPVSWRSSHPGAGEAGHARGVEIGECHRALIDESHG